ncbi:hypothetical protein B0H21DRAFT_567733 [Amylocystis lapponica]|nr:hypothetical protein B0H21DRAFT_567733 [Amylocystis lapponica]
MSSAPSSSSAPLLASGDWTKNLVHLAKTAELKCVFLASLIRVRPLYRRALCDSLSRFRRHTRVPSRHVEYCLFATRNLAPIGKHALTLQLHTAHILSAHASLEQKNKAIQDLKEQKNKLESERVRLLNCLREVNEDRDKADILEGTLNRECAELTQKIQAIQDGDYAAAKQDVDRLRQELGQPPLPSLQTTLEEKSAQYLKELRLQADAAAVAAAGTKRSGEELGSDGQPVGKRPRGRPKGSKNSKNKGKGPSASTPTPAPGSTPVLS